MTEAAQKTAQGVRTVAGLIPAGYRALIYSVLGALIGLEAIWDFLPSVVENKLLASLSVLGFGMAAVNAAPTKPT